MSTPTPDTPPSTRAGVSDDEIRAYLGLNPNRSDAEIASDMDRYGVTVADMARATGGDEASIRNRYDTAKSTMRPSVPVEVSPTHPPIERPPGFSSVNEIIGSKYPADMLEEVRAKTDADRKKMATEYGLPETKKFMLERRAPKPADGLDFATMSAAGPMTTLSARGGTRLMKKGGAVKKMTKGKW